MGALTLVLQPFVGAALGGLAAADAGLVPERGRALGATLERVL